MSATNLTKNLKLSQFVASDKPSWLGDVNGDNKKIDDGYGVLVVEISKANNTASSAKSQSDANTQTLTNVNSELEDYGNRITALEAGGGMEQLEQRVNTLSTDVEALNTKADTFEEDILQNGTDITTLKEKVAKIEPKVKANANNITSLTATTKGYSQTIQDLTANVSSVTTTANTANTNATSALRIGQDAYNKSVSNENSISSMNAKIETKTSVTINYLTFKTNNLMLEDSSNIDIYDGNMHNLLLMLQFGSRSQTTLVLSSTPTTIGSIDLSSIYPDSLNKNLLWNDTTFYVSRTGFIISATKTTDSSVINITLKSVANNKNLLLNTPILLPLKFSLY